MDNDFFKFVEKYWDDIVAFFDSLFNFFKALIEKLQSPEEDVTDSSETV